MSFLSFLKKKQNESRLNEVPVDVPLPQTKVKSPEGILPSFADEQPLDELKLPEIPELEEPKTASPEIPPPTTEPPAMEEPMPIEESTPLATPKPVDALEAKPEENRIEPVKPKADYIDVPKLIPKEAPRPLFRRHGKEVSGGDVFIKGEEYRGAIETLDSIIAQKEVTEKQETAEKKHEKEIFKTTKEEHDEFEHTVEELQRNLAAVEKILFEQKR